MRERVACKVSLTSGCRAGGWSVFRLPEFKQWEVDLESQY
ncbi:hypothetical protein GCWU000324_00051 [Kingella oralis ATCC 51147]|uniref:Uncharacterized protein n=1 Tax=Kingella oralis ATCC 51147 TaxID=629741 RepID=C4GEG4_9NEIS|nr:hypothetical protein GCWU000324_00051 [Kingella oralis ATCC 51147]